MYYFILYFVILCILQYLYIKFMNQYISSENIEVINKVEYIKNNNIQIDKYIKNILQERINLLDNGMSYLEWIKYNIINKTININYKDPIFVTIYENINSTDNFILRVNHDDFLNNVSWTDTFDKLNNIFFYTRYKVDKDLISNMFKNNLITNDLKTINYYWIDSINFISILKKCYYLRYKSKDGIEGVIFISYPVQNLTKGNLVKNIYNLSFINIIISYIILLIISIVIIILNKNDNLIKIKSYIFLTVINIYFWYYFNSYDQYSSTNTEHQKLTIFSSHILSVSYLIAVNIFILGTLNKIKSNILTFETMMLFSFSVFLLLLSIFKVNSFITYVEIIKERISLSFLFNYSIILNIFIIINYIFYNYRTNFNKIKL